MQRTHLYKHDLDWLPPSYRAIRWAVAGSIWTGLVGGVAAISILSHVYIWAFGKGLAVLAAGGYVAGDRAARGVLRGRLRKLAAGAVDLKRLPAEADGELIHVTGKVRALGGQPVVYQREVFSFDGATRLVHEVAEDFWLVGDGEPVRVEVGEARLLADGKVETIDAYSTRALELEALAAPHLRDRTLQQRAQRREKKKKLGDVRVQRYELRDGAAVEIVGYKSRTIDPTVAMRMERDTPFRATLKGGHTLPLLIVPRPA